MPDTETAGTDTEPLQPARLPENAQEMLRAVLDAGNIAHIEEPGGERIIAGTPERPGQALPGTMLDWLDLVGNGLIGGERRLILTRRRGRYVARHGTDAGFDDSITDLDLSAWSRGTIDYLQRELLEAVEAFHYEIVLTRREALDLLIKKGVVTADEARKDV